MPDPTSITCPHCTASFKVKSTSAFGKKVKCPKCEEPFVIQSPSIGKAKVQKKKSNKVKPKLDYLDDVSDSPTNLYEDDFDDWDDDLSGGSPVKPTRKKNQNVPPKKKKIQSSFSLRDYGLSPFITGLFVFLVLINLVLFFMQSPIFMLSIFLSLVIGTGCLLAGGIGLLIEAGKESGGELLLCMLLPLYNIYYAISRFEQTKHSLGTFGTGLSLICISYVLMAGFLSNRLSPSYNNVAYTPPAVSTAPNFNQNTNWNPFTSNNNQPDQTSQPRTPANTSSSVSSQPTNTKLTKFDLSQTKPMLMTWPVAGVSGSGVYNERKTGSSGTVFETSNTRSFDGDTPAGGRMKFRVYLPVDIDPASPVPCILVPPAGSNLLTGMDIDPADLSPNPEHEPYVKAGFAVVTFSLDGHLWRREQASPLELKMAYKEFKKSKAGLVNCVHAFLETQAVIPGIDKNNIFIAGHSSAGTLSLLFAEHYPQIKGCLAYAPSVDLKKSMADFLPELKPLIPDVEDFIRLSSPQTHIKDLKCPLFLFHSRGDQVTSFQNSYQFASQLTAQGTNVEFVAGNGSDHYQTMIDEGLTKGIAWIKKQLKNTNSAQPAPQMAAAVVTEKKELSKSIPQPAKSSIDLTRRKATLKVTGFDKFYTDALKNNDAFWTKSLISKIELGLKDIVPDYAKGSIELNLKEMTFNFEYIGTLPKNIPQNFADHFFAKSITLSDEAPTVEIVSNKINSLIMDSNSLTFRIRFFNSIKFNKSASPKIIEANLKQIDRYVPDSLVMNYDNEWAYIKLKGIGDKSDTERAAVSAFQMGGITVISQKIDLTPADLAMHGTATTNAGTVNTTPASTTKQKYIIRYGVYGGKSVKESVKRSLKGFVWVDQKSIQFNPDTKEISFINQSAVDQGALDRALTRNKFYQLNITQEAVPQTNPKPEKAAAKTDTN